MPGKWLVDNRGEATDDPAALKASPPGAILPLGGLDRGHKGFGLGLMVEALTAGLGGYGRADKPTSWGASVFLQMIDPEAFGANRGRDDRASHGERFEDLESRAAAGTQRHHIHRAFRD